MQRLTTILACVGGLAVGAALFSHRPPRDAARGAAKSAPDTSPDLQALQAEVDALRRETRALSFRATPTAFAAESASPAAPKLPNPADEKIANERAYSETKYKFERSFASDTGTSDWGRTTESSLKSTVDELTPEVARQVVSVNCRTKICRIETEHESHRESMDFMDVVEGRPGFAGAKYVRIRSQAGTEKYEFFLEPRVADESVQERL